MKFSVQGLKILGRTTFVHKPLRSAGRTDKMAIGMQPRRFDTEQYQSAAQLGCLRLETTPQPCSWQVCHLGPRLEILCRDQLEAQQCQPPVVSAAEPSAALSAR